MPIRIVIHGREISNPLVKSSVGVLMLMLFFSLTVVILFIILPLIGLTFAFIFGIIVSAFITTLLSAVVFWLSVVIRHRSKKKLPEDGLCHRR